MAEINTDNLESALSPGNTPSNQEQKIPSVSKEMEIGHHQGALSTLVNERNELFKMIQNVEMVMQAHIKSLEELGVKIQTQQQEQKKE